MGEASLFEKKLDSILVGEGEGWTSKFIGGEDLHLFWNVNVIEGTDTNG